jgi:GAF domain-containing protein
VFGNIYVTEAVRGPEFSAEDQELLTALAATAAVAIDNARLYESARARGEWLQASAAVTRQLLDPDAGGVEHPLRLIAEHSRAIGDADLAVVLRPVEAVDPVQLAVEVVVGAGADVLLGRPVPLTGTLAGRVFGSRQPERVPQLQDPAGLSALLSGRVDVGPVMAVPLLGSGRVHGVLCAARLQGRPTFSAADLDMAGSFANHAAVAIELAEARAQQQRALLLGDRERIAADLHDHVIQRLFATGLTLQSVAAGLGQGPHTERLRGAIENLDDTIRQIRTTIFQLQQEPAAAPRASAAGCWACSPTSRRCWASNPGCASPGCSRTRCPTTSSMTCSRCSGRR